MTEEEMVGWHHRLNGPEFEQAPGVGDGQGGLACCSPWGLKESADTPGSPEGNTEGPGTASSEPGLPVHHQLPEFTQTHVHRISDAIQPSHPLLLGRTERAARAAELQLCAQAR